MIYRFIIIFYFAFINSAYAYLDPGSASLILQGILAGIVGGIATLGIYWSRFKQFVKNLFKNKNNTSKTENKKT